MLIAMGVSLVFTFTYATWAAKNPRAGTLLVPLLDILQSVPILCFLSVTVGLVPVAVAGAGLRARNWPASSPSSPARPGTWPSASTSRCAPCRAELDEAGRMFGLSAWARFWRIEAPFATPPLIWNMMM